MNGDEQIRQVVRTIGDAAPEPPALKTRVQLPRRRSRLPGPAVGVAAFVAIVALFVIGQLVVDFRNGPASQVASLPPPTDTTETTSAPTQVEPMKEEGARGDSEDFRDDLDSLQAAFEAYVDCAEPDLDGYIRVRFDRFVGYTGEVGLPDGRDDFDLIRRLSSTCEISSDLADQSSAFQAEHPPTQAQLQAIVAEVTTCLEAAGMDYATHFGQLQPQGFSDLNAALGAIPFPSDASRAEAVMGCVDEAVYGPKIEY